MPNPDDLPPRRAERRPTAWADVAMLAVLCAAAVAVVWLLLR